MDTKYVIERTEIETGHLHYLSPGRVNWVSPADHRKYNTRYGKWLWTQAESISSNLNKMSNGKYTYVPLPARNHP